MLSAATSTYTCNTRHGYKKMNTYKYTQGKKQLEDLYASLAFSPSSVYKIQSPFEKTSTWDLWFKYLDNRRNEFVGNGLVHYHIDAVLMLIEDFGIDPETITFVSDNENKTILAKSWGVKIKGEGEDLKFNYNIKNPPWDGGKWTEWVDEAVDRVELGGIVLDILPSNFGTLTGAAKYNQVRKTYLEHFQILSVSILDNSKKQVFSIDAGGSDVMVIVARRCKKPDNTMVDFDYHGGDTFTVDLTKHDIWPMYCSALGYKIYNLVVGKKSKDLTHGSSSNDNPRTPNTSFYISTTIKWSTRAMGLVERNPGTSWSKGQMKKVDGDIVWFEFSDEESYDLHYDWFTSDLYSYILEMQKSQSKNQGACLAAIGEFDFADNDFDKFFGMTEQYKTEVRNWKSK
jgi:hypothetical protein